MWLIASEIAEEARDMLAHYASRCVPQICQSGGERGLKIFIAEGLSDFSSVQRCEVKVKL